MILLVDNYDSFVFNLARYLQRLGQAVEVVRNDRIDMERITRGDYQAIVISPGPQAPDQAGRCLDLVRQFGEQVPMLGVCLGHQIICQAFGGRIIRAPRAVHGRPCSVHHEPSRLFHDVPNPFTAARYHSLIAERESLPKTLRITATTDHRDEQDPSAAPEPLIMAVEHRTAPLFGVQFHPESILTPDGYRLLCNFLIAAGISIDLSSLPDSDLIHPEDLAPRLPHPSSTDDEEDDESMPPAVLPRTSNKSVEKASSDLP